MKALLVKTLCVSVNQNVRLDKEKTAEKKTEIVWWVC